MKSDENHSLTAKTVKGVAWSILGMTTRQVLVLCTAVVVARILSPEDFARGGIGVVIISTMLALISGFVSAIVRERARGAADELFVQTAFWIIATLGTFLGLFVAGVGLVISCVYSDTAILNILLLVSVGVAVGSIGSFPLALLRREMAFKTISIIDLISSFAACTLAILLAVHQFGYLALVVPFIAQRLVGALAGFISTGFTPKLTFGWSPAKRILRFGSVLAGSSLLEQVSVNLDYFVMSAYLPTRVFGFYYFAFENAKKPALLLSSQLGSVLFSAFSQVNNDLSKLRRGYFKATLLLSLVLFPIHVLLIGTADWLIPFVFGPQWKPAVFTFQVFLVAGFMRALGTFVGPALLAINEPGVNFRFNLFRITVLGPVLLALGYANADFEVAAIVIVLVWYLQSPFYLASLFRRIQIGFDSLFRVIRRVVFASLAMACTLHLTRLVLTHLGFVEWHTVIIASAISSSVFVIANWSHMLTLANLARTILGKQQSSYAS